VADFAAPVFCGAALLFGAAFPTVKYFLILSSRFLPMPRIGSKSSTLLNAPYDLRICRILSAVAGPIPEHLLQLRRTRGINIYRPGRRLLLRINVCDK
jgi:hypothetical protein